MILVLDRRHIYILLVQFFLWYEVAQTPIVPAPAILVSLSPKTSSICHPHLLLPEVLPFLLVLRMDPPRSRLRPPSPGLWHRQQLLCFLLCLQIFLPPLDL